MQQSASDVGLPASAPALLLEKWGDLRCWDEVPDVLCKLKALGYSIGVVTNCSNALGHAAVTGCEAQVQAVKDFKFDAVTTAEESGYYKPHPKPYKDLLAKLGVAPEDTLFVAGSASDVPGASNVGMRVVWHNRVGLPGKGEVKALKEGRTLGDLLEGVVSGF